MNFVGRYNQRVDQTDSLLCVGLDSALGRLPKRFQNETSPQFSFNKWVISKTQPFVSAFKLNFAFYEAQGLQGMTALRQTMDFLHENYPGIVTIADAKRTDIGSSNEGYASAIFDKLGFDAVTLHPYLGQEALRPFLEREDKGCIILCRTSNPGAGEFQDLLIGNKPLWQVVAEKVGDKWNKLDNCLLVVGATYPDELAQIRQLMGEMTLLVPGIGAQGASVKQTITLGLNCKGRGLIINSSRGIIFSHDPRRGAQILKDQINRYR